MKYFWVNKKKILLINWKVFVNVLNYIHEMLINIYWKYYVVNENCLIEKKVYWDEFIYGIIYRCEL